MNSRRLVAGASLLIATLPTFLAGGCQTEHTTPEHSENARIRRVTESLQQPMVVEGVPSKRWNLEERMRRFSVPAVSVAVIDDGQLAWARSWGVIEAGGEDPVSPETIFQAGSVSKPVAALLALMLVEDGELALDQPVNEVLKSWKVPDNELTRQQPVTLRHVLTHQAGFTPAGYLIPRDGSPVSS
jgi:CubicO group peptidase (beta-lactamase class C family)